MKRDLRKAEEEEKWREKVNTRSSGKLTIVTIDKPDPYNGETRGEEEQETNCSDLQQLTTQSPTCRLS